MILIVCAWIFWFLICLTIGTAALRLLYPIGETTVQTGYSIFYRFWFGFTIIIALLQILSLFLPIRELAFGTICGLTALALIFNFRSLSSEIIGAFHKMKSIKAALVMWGILIIVVFVAYSANKQVTHTDTFIYHYNAVKWAREYPVVPGLVNLHGRLAFNSSFFLFAALTEVGLYSGHSAHIALSFLIVVALLHWCAVISNPHSSIRARIFCMMTFIFLVIHASLKMDIASLATDYPMAVMLLVSCLVAIDRLNNKFPLLLALTAVAFTFKFSSMPAVGIGLLAVVARIIYLRQDKMARCLLKCELRADFVSLIVSGIIITGFIVRNVILSGWLLYPFPIGNLHLPWSSPESYVTDMIDWIKSYPKLPGGASPDTIKNIGFFGWFPPWFNNFSQSLEYFFFLASLIVLLWSGLTISRLSSFVKSRVEIIIVLVVALLGICFWFTSAPDVRFGSVYFYILFAASIIMLYESSSSKQVLKLSIYAGFVYLIVQHTPAYVIDRAPLLFTFAYTQQPELKKVKASPGSENPPLYIYMPAQGNQCGNSPIPCTPYAGGKLHNHQLIRQRVPGDLSKGFLPPQ